MSDDPDTAPKLSPGIEARMLIDALLERHARVGFNSEAAILHAMAALLAYVQDVDARTQHKLPETD